MENNSIHHAKKKDVLQHYHNLTSPLSSLQLANQKEQAAQEVRLNASVRLDSIKTRGSKVQTQRAESFADLKAASVLYQIP